MFQAELVRQKVVEALDLQVQCFARYTVPGQVKEINTIIEGSSVQQ